MSRYFVPPSIPRKIIINIKKFIEWRSFLIFRNKKTSINRIIVKD